MLRAIKYLLLIGLLAVTWSAKAEISKAKDQTYFTQVNMWAEKNKSIATNYAVGRLIPINTEIKVLRTTKRGVVFEIVDEPGSKITLLNAQKHTLMEIGEIFARTFKKSKVDLTGFSEEVQQAIMAGKVKVGMTKDEVLLARGYPPKIGTNSLDLNVWRYWRNRFVNRSITFVNGKVGQPKNDSVL